MCIQNEIIFRKIMIEINIISVTGFKILKRKGYYCSALPKALKTHSIKTKQNRSLFDNIDLNTSVQRHSHIQV
jgi:hypothetical protein